ncbi:M20/M25/M40 family metallo-hydrolase [Pseudoduganella eburnea]|uniref:M20/M25/M40 family metallo-hydrolase n=1 Tax=Massilia eburnea TaxID=1776165 RepID=A0A6L6QEL6_9BURK|nr:M20/M25/M40 family metallo-hydrolase [Massilia eburnea]MTW10639.1 M20/M25/M40 family metallo-hydrolase [Massilia eburnea]
MAYSKYTLLAAAIAAAASSAFAAAPDTDRHQPQVDKIVGEISAQRIESNIRKLVSFKTRHTMSETESDTVGIGAARRWIKSEMERCGAGRLQVAFDSHIAPVSARISRPTEVVNVVATLPGAQAESKDRVYVVSGHYDSRNSDIMDAKNDAPGANDDASGTAAVMEMACVMAKYKFDATLVFMAVAGEEQGLLGARHYAEQAKAKGVNIAGMFTNDIIGSSHDEHGNSNGKSVRLFAEGLPVEKETSETTRMLVSTGGENDSLSRQLARHVKEQGERYVPGFKVNVIQRRDRYLRGGDHMPFLEKGYAALRFTEPAEDFSHQHQNLRTENGKVYGDLPEFDDFNYIAQVARVNAAALATLANAPAAPAKVQVRTKELENDTAFVWQANKEPDIAGYRIVWRESGAADWQASLFVGNVTDAKISLSKDNFFFGIQAIDKDGNASPASYPTPLR